LASFGPVLPFPKRLKIGKMEAFPDVRFPLKIEHPTWDDVIQFPRLATVLPSHSRFEHSLYVAFQLGWAATYQV
jgi:hypothetical protein